MIALLAILQLRMNITDGNLADFLKISSVVPSFSYFYTPDCLQCHRLMPVWENLTKQYETDTDVLVAQCDCLNYPDACQNTSSLAQYPAFLSIVNNAVMQIKIERTLPSFVRYVEELKSLDLTVQCSRNLNQSDHYPYVAMSFPDDDATACDRLITFSKGFPNLPNRFLLARQTEAPSVEVILSMSWRFNHSGSPDDEYLRRFITDHIHPPLAGWPLNESYHITVRRFGFMIHREQNDIPHAFWFGNEQIKKFCFVAVNVSDFREDYPHIDISDTELPALAITSSDQSKFMLIRNADFNYNLSLFVDNITKEDTHPDMIFPYRYYRPPVESETHDL